LNETFAEASRSDVVFVVADLAETLSGASPVFANLFRTQGALTIGVALMPLAFGGHILSSK
jgi:cell division GTPase FtsZ